jgi:hypothetical protein
MAMRPLSPDGKDKSLEAADSLSKGNPPDVNTPNRERMLDEWRSLAEAHATTLRSEQEAKQIRKHLQGNEASKAPKESPIPVHTLSEYRERRSRPVTGLSRLRKWWGDRKLKKLPEKEREEIAALARYLEENIPVLEDECLFSSKDKAEAFAVSLARKGYKTDLRENILFHDDHESWRVDWEAPYHFQSENAGSLLSLLKSAEGTQVDVVEVLDQLRNIGFRITVDDLLRGSKHIATILEHPKTQELLRYLRRWGTKSRHYWIPRSDQSNEGIDQLVALLDNPALQEEATRRDIDTLMVRLGNHAQFESIQRYPAIATNAHCHRFLELLDGEFTQSKNQYEMQHQVEQLEALQREHLLEPLIVALEIGLPTEEMRPVCNCMCSLDAERHRQEASAWLQAAKVQPFIQKADFRTFAQNIAVLMGRPLSLKNIHGYQKLFSSQNIAYAVVELCSRWGLYPQTSLEETIEILEDQEIVEMLLQPEFQEFVTNLQNKLQYRFTVRELKNKYKIIYCFNESSPDERQKLCSADAATMARFKGGFDPSEWKEYIQFLSTAPRECPHVFDVITALTKMGFTYHYPLVPYKHGYYPSVQYSVELASVMEIANNPVQRGQLLQETTKDFVLLLEKDWGYQKKLDDLSGILRFAPQQKTLFKTAQKLTERGFPLSQVEAALNCRPLILCHAPTLLLVHEHQLEEFLGSANTPEVAVILFNHLRESPESIISLPPEKKKIYIETILRVIHSPSRELQRIRAQLIPQVLQSPDPLAAYQNIEDVFVCNNLPLVGKLYRIFGILHNPQSLEASFDRHPYMSPRLKQQSPRGKFYTIYKDLLRIHLTSGNSSLRTYLEILKEGEEEMKLIESSSLETLHDYQLERVANWLGKLETLLRNSLLGGNGKNGKKAPIPTNKVQLIEWIHSHYAELRRSMRVNEDQNLNQRIAEMFLKPLCDVVPASSAESSYPSLDDALSFMNESSREADRRNRELIHQTTDGKVHLQEGDFVKGVQDQYIGLILQNGSVAKEYLGASADSDRTPLDTDLSRITRDDAVAGFQSAIDASLAKDYGELLLVIRNRGQLQLTTANTKAFDEKKWELFHTPILSDKHYGIRTGFPSTEIDCIVANQNLVSSSERLEKVFYHIVQSGRYIPVCDTQGTILFTPEMYDQRHRLVNIAQQPSFDRKEVEQALQADYEPAKLLRLFEQDFGEEFEKDAGVGEGYTLKQHTLMVLKQFDRYFGHLPDANAWRVLIVLHDIGKPEAIVRESKEHQHEYTLPIAKAVLKKLGYGTHDVRAWATLVAGDPIGKYLQYNDLHGAASTLVEMVQEAEVPFDVFFNRILILFQADAGSYTADAGGKASLDSLFIFDRDSGQMKFAPETAEKVEQLRRYAKVLWQQLRSDH